MEAAAGKLQPDGTAYLDGQTVVQHLFSQAVADNVGVIRAFGHGATGNFVLQPLPGNTMPLLLGMGRHLLLHNQAWTFTASCTAGQYNEAAFQALDQIIAEADKAGVKLILTLTDNWRTADGLYGYVIWGGGQHPEEFFVNPAIIQLYKNHQAAMANRMNTITRRMYKDEPAIFAWDLINEPRSACDLHHPNATCDAPEAAAIQAWIQQAADHMKAVDPNHMVTVGEEGFYGFGAPAASIATNPNSDNTGWAEKAGQNFLENHTPPSIDFAATHIWTDNWEANTTFGVNPKVFVNNWISARAADARSLNKPLVIEEFGKQLPVPADAATIASVRDPIFADIYAALQNVDIIKGTGFCAPQPSCCFPPSCFAAHHAGVAYWEYDYLNGATDSDNLVRMSDSTWSNILQPAAAAVVQKAAELPMVNGCIPGVLMASSGSSASTATPTDTAINTPSITSSIAGASSPEPAISGFATPGALNTMSPAVATSGRKMLQS
ncbi:TPA: hypothetical protein ACH3X1_011186 [Trebouxia sp. C0004]